MGCNMKLQDAIKGYTFDQDKIVTPEETVERFKNKLKDVNLDILEETVRIDNGRLDIPVYFSVCGRDALEIIGTKKQMEKAEPPASPRPVRSWSWRSGSAFSASGKIPQISAWIPTKT